MRCAHSDWCLPEAHQKLVGMHAVRTEASDPHSVQHAEQFLAMDRKLWPASGRRFQGAHRRCRVRRAIPGSITHRPTGSGEEATKPLPAQQPRPRAATGRPSLRQPPNAISGRPFARFHQSLGPARRIAAVGQGAIGTCDPVHLERPHSSARGAPVRPTAELTSGARRYQIRPRGRGTVQWSTQPPKQRGLGGVQCNSNTCVSVH
jgi:hypothetical protein